MGKGKVNGSPIKFRVVGFKLVCFCFKDNIVGAYIGDIEFSAFLVVVFVQCHDANSLDSNGAY